MARSGESKTSPRRLLAKQRQADALRLRLSGVDYREIAERVGYRGPSAAFDAVKAALRTNLAESAGDELFANLRRLDMLLAAVWDKAVNGQHVALQDALSVLGERARLMGLYPAPGSRRQEHIDEDLLRQEARRVAEHMGLDPDAAVAEVELLLREQR